jgi:Zn-dependent peptidase ImmA (M78 family)
MRSENDAVRLTARLVRHSEAADGGHQKDQSVRVQDVRSLFDSERLRLARELRGLSQKAVAEEAGRLGGERLTSAAVSQFERGDSTPTADRIEALAAALQVPAGYFARVQPADTEVPAFFRSLRSTSATQRRRARAIAHLAWQFTSAIEEHVMLPDLDHPRHPLPLDATPDAVEEVAGKVRREWKLERGPVANVVRELERHGVIVVRLLTGEARMDAFSVAFHGRPVVVLTDDKGDRSRSRFDAAHELGHLVMHEPDERATKEAENQAHWFAAGFLMPVDDIRHELPSRADWRALLDLKQEWDVSVQALLRRAKTLGVMSDNTYLQAVKTLSARGWRTDEPGSIGPPERPTLLSTAVRLVEDEGISDLASVAEGAHLPRRDVEQLLGDSRDSRPEVSI